MEYFDDNEDLFLSTPSARRATESRGRADRRFDISIHALREEGDLSVTANTTPPNNFYPRPPRGGRRPGYTVQLPYRCNFYPRPPRGGRRVLATKEHRSITFLSTPSARRATSGGTLFCCFLAISIHALREEGDGTASILCFHI